MQTKNDNPGPVKEKAASQFGAGPVHIEPLGGGLIHQTYKASYPGGKTIVLQQINRSTFPQPENILHNYRLIMDFLAAKDYSPIPALLPTIDGKDFWVDGSGDYWRATAFIADSCSFERPRGSREVYDAANAFAKFTHALNDFPVTQLKEVLPEFHNLALRYQQFEDTLKTANIRRLLQATHVISEIRDRVALIDWYNTVAADNTNYPLRVMHHDCKISNILFDEATKKVICPVDLDTVMPGKYFSDLGDMIRTMTCTEDENSVSWETIDVVPEYYTSVMQGYIAGMGDALTKSELKDIDNCGLVLTYMQCIRFVTDFLNNDTYYATRYEGQNLNRALNQLILLEKIEAYIHRR